MACASWKVQPNTVSSWSIAIRVFSILNHPCSFAPCSFNIISLVFLYLSWLPFSGFIHKNTSKCCTWAPLKLFCQLSSTQSSNLVPRDSHLITLWSDRGETMGHAGHVPIWQLEIRKGSSVIRQLVASSFVEFKVSRCAATDITRDV